MQENKLQQPEENETSISQEIEESKASQKPVSSQHTSEPVDELNMAKKLPNAPQPENPPKQKRDSERTAKTNPFTWIQSLFGATALITAALFVVSWIYNRKYFGGMGLHGYTVRYTTQDYILNAKSVLAIGIVVLFLLIYLYINPKWMMYRFRLFISIIGMIGVLAILTYILIDLGFNLSSNGFKIGFYLYKTTYLTLLGIGSVFFYSIIAPTILYKKCINSKYREYAYFIAWSSFSAFAIIFIGMTAHFLGVIEGRKDTSENSRLESISVATKEPLGFGIQPDEIITDNNQNIIYLYYNMRFLTQFDGVLYVLKPEPGQGTPMIHVLPQDKAFAVSLGINWNELQPVFELPTPTPIPVPTTTP
ncbi:MAG: hypothetical protein DWQ04_00510 [Chloroflexi bacterium]|nr:MAG: hypothetical protein DWQ04_00510 [Chloroflexota bacterium]